MRRVLFALIVLSVPSLVTAQTHPCDQPAPTSATVSTGAPHKVQFCAKPADAPEAFTVYINGVASDLRPLTMTVAASSTGQALYEGPRDLQFQKGSYDVRLTLWNRAYVGGPSQESAKSSPLSLSAVDDAPPAAAPKVLGIVR